MWIRVNDRLKTIIKETVQDALDMGEGLIKKLQELRADVRRLTEEKQELEYQKKMEEKEIAHLVKMKEEKIGIETEKKRLELTQQFQEKTMKLQTEYFDKVMNAVKEGHDKMEEIYGKIMERLPNVNMEISKKSR